eukprot:TRINITY_DN1367_c0_g1_i1.p1 TRINITY_DN1367_c0_g1~~TRINITY_DN1367_c0_g1_i1.p1  ORF type:complete len:996 (-),score=306.74 TRINITY_DN1367_c0_g1_i1:35-3022(-)
MNCSGDEKMFQLWQQLTLEKGLEPRRAAAREIASLVRSRGIKSLEELGILGMMKESMGNLNAPLEREGALLLVPTLCDFLSHACEPQMVQLLPLVIERMGDKVAPVKIAADMAGKAVISMLCPHAVKLVLQGLFDGIRNRKNWKGQVGSLQLLGQLARTGPRQVAACMPQIVPLLSEQMVDGKEQVMKAAYEAMVEVAGCIGNRDIEPMLSQLVSCILKPGEVPECIHKLSGVTFIQAVLGCALAIMVPLFVRGMKERQTLVKRKTVVVIDNVLRLVDDPKEAAPFLPALLPGVERVSVEVADPECRATAARVHKTLLGMKAEVESPEATEAVKMADPAVVLGVLKGVIASGAREEAEQMQQLFGASLDYVSGMCAGLIEAKCFEPLEWNKCVVPYMEPFLAPWGEDAEAVSKQFLEKIINSLKGSDDQDCDDDEGEDLCNCEFSLGYGGKILLNSTRLWLKRGRRYGLCGPNGAGKSTLMRAIANGKLDGFPPPEMLRTMYVEHDLDSSVVEHDPVEYLLSEPLLKERVNVNRESVEKVLREMVFTPTMLEQPIRSLSGGWKMKLALARAVLLQADILLLDEPTNHLDIVNVDWLQRYLVGLKGVSCMIVSHDSGFLDTVCTDIIHYEKRKLKHYRGNLSAFVKVKPEARVYYDLGAAQFKYNFPEPGLLEGIKRKETPILKLTNVSFTYPGASRQALVDVNVQCGLGSRVAVIGANGAGKSTLIKLLTGETKPTTGIVWRHPNLGMAYVAQHAFHHVEQHLEKSPNEYIQWRFARGEDREELQKVHRKISKEEEKSMQDLIMHNGQRKQVEQLLARRKSKKSYEYEVKWVGLKPVFNSWLSRELLEDLGFEKLVHDVDAKEVARLGVYQRPLTIPGVQAHFDDFGLDAEFATYGQIGNLSGGQKVKVVLAAAMWSNPHMIVLDEPTNFLDRDSLGALTGAIKDFNGGVVVISHNAEFLDTLTNERWTVADGRVSAPGNPAYEKAIKGGAGKKK